MAIEPLSSTMSLQAQNIKTMPTRTVNVEGTESQVNKTSTTQEAAKVDKTLSIVESTQEKSTDQRTDQQVSNEQIKKAVEKLNRSMAHSEAVFGIHEGTNRVTIKIIDKETKEIIKELPPEKTLDMIAKVWELAGILVDEKR